MNFRRGLLPPAHLKALISAGFCLLLAACSAAHQPESTPHPTVTDSPIPTRTLRPAPTVTPTPSVTPTPTLPPYPEAISQDNLDKLSLLYRFNSLGFYDAAHDWLVLYDNQQTALWDLRSGALIATFIGRYKAAGGDYLLTSTGSDLLLWRVSTGEQLLNFPAAHGQFHPTQPWLVVYGGELARAQLWDCQNGRLLGRFRQYPEDFFTFSPDGALLAASGGAERRLRVWSLPDLAQNSQSTFSGSSNSTWAAFTADSRYLIVSGSQEHEIFDLQSGESIWHDSRAWAVYPGPSADYALVTSYATTHILDLESGEYLDRYLLGDAPEIFPKMDLITSYDAAETGYRVYIYRASDFEQLAVLRIPKGVASSGSFQPDAEIFALSDLEGVLHFFDSGSWEELTTLAGMEGFFIGRPQFSQGGHWLLFSWYTYDEFGDYFSGFDVWGIPE